MKDYDPIDAYIIKNISSISQDIMSIIIDQSIAFFPYMPINISWVQMVSYLKSYYY